MLRAGSAESSATQIGGGGGQFERAAAAPATACMPHLSCSPASILPAGVFDTPSSQGSKELDMHAWGPARESVSPDTCTAPCAAAAAAAASTIPCAAAAAPPRAHQAAATQHQEQQAAAAPEQPHARVHPSLSPAFLAELADANAVIQRLPLPGDLLWLARL